MPTIVKMLCKYKIQKVCRICCTIIRYFRLKGKFYFKKEYK